MTRETLEKANALLKRIEDLKSTYESLQPSNWVEWHLRAIWNDGCEDYVAVLDDEIMEHIRKVYAERITRAEQEFSEL